MKLQNRGRWEHRQMPTPLNNVERVTLTYVLARGRALYSHQENTIALFHDLHPFQTPMSLFLHLECVRERESEFSILWMNRFWGVGESIDFFEPK